MSLSISQHFTYSKLFRFTFPTVLMMVVTSIYGVVDGFFISNFAGKEAFTAVNFIMPLIMILSCSGFMFGTGGSALVAKLQGEGKSERANRVFSMIVYASLITGLVLMGIGFAILEPAARMMGASGSLLSIGLEYVWILLFVLPVYMLQFEFQVLFSTAGKPNLGLYVTLGAGVLNMVLDWLFLAVFHWGHQGAALATAISICAGGLIPLAYFASKKNGSTLHLVKTGIELRPVLQACGNGFSELLGNIAGSLVSMLFNMQLLKYAGQDGVAAFGVLMYVSMIFMAIFFGYTSGAAPLFSYQYGAGNHVELKNLMKKSLVIITGTGVLMVLAGLVLARPLSMIFVGYDPALLSMTIHAFAIYSFSFILAGYAIYNSALFTALNNGVISAILAGLRTLVFQIGAVLTFPLWMGLDGIWWSIVFAEAASMLVGLALVLAYRKRYGY